MPNHTRRILIFTGAGASYGCEHVLPKQPPLSNQLYDELAACFPDSWGRIPIALASQFRTNFEEGMDVVWQRQSLNVPPLMRDMAIYFSSFHPDGQRLDLYSRLIENIVRNNLHEQTVLSTINYDCILEMAVSSLGLKIDYFSNSSSNKEKITLWKLHGSCNFMPSRDIGATRGVTYTAGVEFNARIEPIQSKQVPVFCSSNTALYPAMAVFAKGKPIQICPSALQQLQQFWTDFVSEADMVVIIGANPNSDDRHIWDVLASTDAELYYVGGRENFETWSHKYRPLKHDSWLAETFRKGFEYLLGIINSR